MIAGYRLLVGRKDVEYVIRIRRSFLTLCLQYIIYILYAPFIFKAQFILIEPKLLYLVDQTFWRDALPKLVTFEIGVEM